MGSKIAKVFPKVAEVESRWYKCDLGIPLGFELEVSLRLLTCGYPSNLTGNHKNIFSK
jgi:hypothetical protein